MSIFSDISNLSNKKRKLEVPAPDTKLLVRGIVLLALGLLGASVYTVEDIDKTPALVFLCIGAALIIAAIISLICYGKQVTAFKKYTPTWEKHRSIFDDFAIELNHWYDSDMRPRSCDGDTSYILRLQKDRMTRKGIRMIQHTSPVKRETMGTTRVPRKTSWYTVDLMYEGVDRHLQFQNSTGIIYERVTEDTMYETVVHTPNEQELTRMSMTCPNCGADMRPRSCDGDTSYILRLQKDRMTRKGIRMIQHTSPVKRETMGTTRVPRKTSWYTVDLMYEGVDRHLQFQNSTGIIYERVTEDTMYETVVHTPNEQELTRMSMTCPNCGAVSPVAALTEGCPYCRTVFRISDLFPRVTNIFFIRENASTKNQKKMGKATGITMLVFFLACFIPSFLDRETPIPQALLMSFFVALIMGGIFGYIISIIIFMTKQFNRDGRKRIPFWSYVTTKGKVKSAFAPYDPYFSFEKFEGQIISLIRMAIMSDHPENLASYCGGTLNPYFRDIIEMTYMQAMTVQDIHMEGSHLCMTLRTWWINYSEKNGRVNRCGDCIDVTLRRNVAYMEPPGFSITSVYCRNCGASFDSVRQRNCPYCGTVYHMENEGFIIERLELV